MKKIFFAMLIFSLQYNMYGQTPTCDTTKFFIKTPNGSDITAKPCGGFNNFAAATMAAAIITKTTNYINR